MKNANELFAALRSEIDWERMHRDLLAFNEWERYSGSDHGEAAARYMDARLRELGLEVETETYPLYRSLPISAKVTACGRELDSTPFVYSAPCSGFEAPLVFDEWSEKGSCSQKDLAERCKDFRGKVVLTFDESFNFGRAAAQAGAVGIVSIWKVDLLHHGTLGGVWGNPEPEELLTRYPMIPYTEIGRGDGEWLRDQVRAGDVTVRLDIEMDNRIVESTMPVALVRGQSEKYVLVSGHYDSWYEGITDNGVANIFMLELARLLKKHQNDLLRSVRLAWWSGHSDARYAGSAWYCDHHFEDLRKNCVAHVNMDICGCMGSDLVGFNTGMLEGRAVNDEVLKDYNDEPPMAPVPMARFADQTFWGADVPFTIMPKYTLKKPGVVPFFWWWHSKEDTIDKVDPAVAVRDGEIIARLTALFANAEHLPMAGVEYVSWMETVLRDLQGHLTKDFDLSPVFPKLEALKEHLAKLEREGAFKCDDTVKRVGGALTRAAFTSADRFGQDPAVDYGLFPGLNIARDQTPDNTTPEYYLALITRFTRQRTRLLALLEEAMA